MLFWQFVLIYLATLFSYLVPARAEIWSLNLYVNNQASSNEPDGTKEKPFTSIIDCLKSISNPLQIEAKINIYLSPSPNVYALAGTDFVFSGQNEASLSISTLIDPLSEKISPATLNFAGSTFELKKFDFIHFSDLNITGENDSLKLIDTSLFLTNVSFDLIASSTSSFIRIVDGKNFSIEGLNLKIDKGGCFVNFSSPYTEGLKPPNVSIKDIRVLYQIDKDLAQTPNKHLFGIFSRSLGPEGYLNITNVNIEIKGDDSPRPGYLSNFEMHTVFSIIGFDHVRVKDLKLLNQKIALIHNSLASFRQINYLEFDSFNISHNLYIPLSNYELFIIKQVQQFSCTNIEISNNVWDKLSGQAFTFTFFRLDEVIQTKLSNHALRSNTLSINLNVFNFLETKSIGVNPIALKLEVYNLTLNNNINIDPTLKFSYLSTKGSSLHQLVIDNVTYKENQLSSRVFWLQTFLYKEKTVQGDLYPPTQLYIKNIYIKDNLKAVNTNFLYFWPVSNLRNNFECLQIVEPFTIWIDGLEIRNNTFKKGISELWTYEVGLFYVIESQLHITNALISNNSFYYYNVLALDQKPSTLVFSEGLVMSNVFLSSKFINMDFLMRSSYCNAIGDNFVYPSRILYRHVFILKSEFSDIVLEQSTLFVLNNGFLSLQNNKFQNIDLNNGLFITTDFTPSSFNPSLPSYTETVTCEALSLQNIPLAWKVYNETRQKALDYHAGNGSFFSMRSNSFSEITALFEKFIIINGHGSKQGFILLEDNSFESLVFHNQQLLSMIEFDSVETLAIIHNTFLKVSSGVVLFSIPQSQNSNLISISHNNIKESYIATFFTYTGSKINTLEFSYNKVNLTDISQTFVNIYVSKASDDWIFDNNHLSSVTYLPFIQKVSSEKDNIFTLYVGGAAKTTTLYFTNNLFESLVSQSTMDNRIEEFNLISVEGFLPVQFNNFIMQDIRMSTPGSLIHIAYSSDVSIRNSQIKSINIYAKNGLINTCASKVAVYDSNFTMITNAEKAGIFMLASSVDHYAIKIKRSSFSSVKTSRNAMRYENSPSVGLILDAKFANSDENQSKMATIQFEMTDCNITNLERGYALKLSQYVCIDCVVKDNFLQFQKSFIDKDYGFVDLFIGVSGAFLIQNVTIEPTSPLSLPLIRVIHSNIELTIENIHIMSEKTHFTLIDLDSGVVHIKDSSFSNIMMHNIPIINIIPLLDYSKNEYIVMTPEVTLQNVQFRDISSPSLSISQRDLYLLQSLTYYWEPYTPYLGRVAIFSAMPGLLKIKNCSFERLTNLSAILLADPLESTLVSPSKKLSVEIIDSYFSNIEYNLGSALTSVKKKKETSFKILNTTFYNNKAFVGGAIAVMESSLEIKDSTFRQNTGTTGGAIFIRTTKESQLILDNTNLIANKASYGGDIVTEASKSQLTFIPDDPSTSGVQSIQEDERTLLLLNASSFDLHQGKLFLAFCDKKGQAAPDFSIVKRASLEVPKDTSSGEASDTFSVPIERKGEVDFNVNISLQGIILKGRAGDILKIILHYESERLEESHVIKIQLRPCLPGEYNNSMVCELCEPLTYSIDPLKPCASCPANAQCISQKQICPIPGFWNNETHQDRIFPCRNDHIERCINNQELGCRNCAPGYTGPLCNVCDFENSYVEGGYLKCGTCSDPKKSLMLAILASVVYMLYQLFSIYTFDSANKLYLTNESDYLTLRKAERSYYMKSLLSYIQIMSILYLASSQVYKSFGLFSQVGNPSSLILYGTQCSMKALGLDYQNFVYYQIILMIVAPLAQFLVIIFIFILISFLCCQITKLEKIAIASVYIIISYQPGVVTNLAQMLSCSTIEGLGYSFLSAHPYWSCDTDKYSFYANYLAIPNLLLWGLILPLAIFLILFVNRHNLQKSKLRTSLGVLFVDLKDKYFYWGVILMVLKVALSILAYGLQDNGEISIFIALLLLWIYQTLVRALKPYKTQAYNNFEISLMNLLIFNIIVARYLLGSNSISIIGQIAFGLSVTLNGGFLLLLLWKVLSLTFLQTIAWFEKSILGRNTSRGAHVPLLTETNQQWNANMY